MDSAHTLRLDPDIAALSPSTPKMTHGETLVERPRGRTTLVWLYDAIEFWGQKVRIQGRHPEVFSTYKGNP